MPQLIFEDDRFVFRCNFAEREIPRDAGFDWSSDDRVWYTTKTTTAAKLRAWASVQAKSKLSKELIEITPWSSPLPSPPVGQEFLPHQLVAARFALERNRSYLGLDPGLGKTIVAALIARALQRPVIYVAPPFLVDNVAEEFRKWAPGIDLEILPDTMLEKAWLEPSSLKGAVLIVDEAHRFKNGKAQRTRALLGHRKQSGVADLFDRVVLMSGTPMPNRPLELFPVLSKLAPETIDHVSEFDYGRHYCGAFRGRWGWDFTGASNVEELGRRVKWPTGPFMLRMKKDLLKLPPKIEEVFVLSAEMSPRVSKMDGKLGAAYDSGADTIRAEIMAKADPDKGDLHEATYRRLLGLEKIKPIVPYIESLLEETNENLLIFAFHKETIARLAKRLKKHQPIVVTGDTPKKDRLPLVKLFQNSKKRRVILGNYQALGIGFAITKADRVLMVEFDWVPGVNDQATDRPHRIGRTRSVLVQYVVFKNSLDKRIIEQVIRKRKTTKHI